MIEIADLLQKAVAQKGWSVTEAANRIGVERSFLSRLLAGKTPPKKREGSRSTGRPDARYIKIAKTLGLNEEEFLKAVAERQAARQAQSSKKPTTTHGFIPPKEIRRRYPRLRRILEDHLPLLGTAAFLRVANEAVDKLLPTSAAQIWQKPLDSLRSPEDSLPSAQRDHFGALPGSIPRRSKDEDAQICRRIAEALLDTQPTRNNSENENRSADQSTREIRTEIASLFIELSYYI